MTTKYEAGTVVQGKVTGIKPFGAFIALDDETQGLVHISEVAHSYVKDINDYLSIGDEVDVKILKVEDGKISLSIRATEPAPERTEKRQRPPRQQKSSSQGSQGFNTLEDKLKEWLKESNDRQAQLNKRLKK
ncbi:S1 domain-containing post-transcriptional regulator GSP13 [Pueribacillus sp. YX66]|uniref:S1 domain-containing post-transcriptional regulator GSP13 n=1 Tax=Pueribacillus sp. YX66 TaxID=3229242 RepID=UPI00358D8F1E